MIIASTSSSLFNDSLVYSYSCRNSLSDIIRSSASRRRAWYWASVLLAFFSDALWQSTNLGYLTIIWRFLLFKCKMYSRLIESNKALTSILKLAPKIPFKKGLSLIRSTWSSFFYCLCVCVYYSFLSLEYKVSSPIKVRSSSLNPRPNNACGFTRTLRLRRFVDVLFGETLRLRVEVPNGGEETRLGDVFG